MTTHKWTHRTPRVRANGERIERGDLFVPTTHERRVWPDRMERQPTCADTTNDGRPCGRTVDEQGGKCWQHEETDAGDDTDDTDEDTE